MEVYHTNHDDIIELKGSFDYEGYQVVRREFFAHINEPSVTFNNYKFYPNTACINQFPTVGYVQALINMERKILALRPCEEHDRDSFQWCNTTSGRRKPKQMTCRLFFAKVFAMMEWNMDHRYRLLGKVIRANGESLIAFDLTATEVYQRISKNNNKPKTSRIPVFPAHWQEQFGLPYHEHSKSMQINIFEGYAVYGIKNDHVAELNCDTTELKTTNLEMLGDDGQ